jgi:restriction-modification system family protein
MTAVGSPGGRDSTEALHQHLVAALGGSVLHHSNFAQKPLELDLHFPLPSRVRVYVYNATVPPGGRATGEHKVQLIVPGQARGERGNFDHSGGRMPLLIGYQNEMDVFVVWDAFLYEGFAYSRNVQVKAETIFEAFAGKIGKQVRHLGNHQTEIVLAARPEYLGQALIERYNLIVMRLAGNAP